MNIGSLYQNINYSQWQAFAAYRSASSGPMENVLTFNIIIKILFFIILFVLVVGYEVLMMLTASWYIIWSIDDVNNINTSYSTTKTNNIIKNNIFMSTFPFL